MSSNTWLSYFNELKTNEEGDNVLSAFHEATTISKDFNSKIICSSTEDQKFDNSYSLSCTKESKNIP